MNETCIKTENKGRLLYIILDRPEKRNAFNPQLLKELHQALIDAENDKQVKVIIIKANGKVFSAGADLAYIQQLQENSYEDNLADSMGLVEVFKSIYLNQKVVIAQVEGHAIAGGCGLATVCDFVFAVPEAKFGYTEVKIGFIPAIVMVFLLRKIGESKAKELLLTGKLFTAAEAHSFGIINDVVAAEDMQVKVASFAESLCKEASGASLTITKSMIANVQSIPLDEGLGYAAEMNAKARNHQDCKKGIAAFLKKESINW